MDFEAIRPSDVAIVPEFTASLPEYQKASTNFDAYAQAVESLWAKGATGESKEYARLALALMKRGDWPEASYWAGRAIDISRTTAAHALSYYLTSHYGIPHGHAVYMVFEYVCRNNGHTEFIKHVPGLKTLRELADDKGVAWKNMVDELFAHVNLKRLDNNPVELKERLTPAPLLGNPCIYWLRRDGVGTNESNTYRRTERKNTTFWSAIQ